MQKPISWKDILLMAALLFWLPDTQTAFSGAFLELLPGRSTKSDVDKKLGAPIKVITEGTQYDYPPQMDATRLSVTFNRDTQIIKSIDIYSEAPYTKSEYQEWYQLGNPEKTQRDKKGNLVEFYTVKGLALHYNGPGDTSIVEYISHYDATEPKKTAPAIRSKDAEYYDKKADQAIDDKDWQQAKQFIDEGLRRYPNFAELWHTRAKYYFKAKTEPGDVRLNEAKNSMFRAYKLNPSCKFAAEMGWLHKEFHNDCTLALSYFEEAEEKGYAKEEPSLLYWMGNCFEEIRMDFSASDYYKKFLSRAPTHKRRPEAEQALSRLNGGVQSSIPLSKPSPTPVKGSRLDFNTFELN